MRISRLGMRRTTYKTVVKALHVEQPALLIFTARWLVDNGFGKDETAPPPEHSGAPLAGKHLYTVLNTMTRPLQTLRPDGEEPTQRKGAADDRHQPVTSNLWQVVWVRVRRVSIIILPRAF